MNNTTHKNSVSFSFSGSGFDVSAAKRMFSAEMQGLKYRIEYTDKRLLNGRMYVSHDNPQADVLAIVKPYASHVVIELN